MEVENGSIVDQETLDKGKRLFTRLGLATLGLAVLLLIEEIVNWHAWGFVITQAVATALLALLLVVVRKTGGLRWLLFMVLLFCGALGFLFGGLHLTDPAIEAVDPLCYWLSAAGLAIVGTACYLLYNYEVDAYLRHQRSIRNPQ